MGASPTGKYGAMWDALKLAGSIRVEMYSDADKAKLMRGIAQIKNLDTKWKAESYANSCKRLSPREVETTASGGLVIEVTLVVGAKYRGGIF